MDNIDKKTSGSKWKKRFSAMVLVPPGADKSNAYISTDTEIIKLNLQTGVTAWKQALSKLKTTGTIGSLEYKNGKIYCKEFMSDKVAIVFNAETDRLRNEVFQYVICGSRNHLIF